MNVFYDANEIYEAGNKAIKAANFKYPNQYYEMNHLLETANIQKTLKEKTYMPQQGKKFIIKERGKIRNIAMNNMVDKTINHLLCDNILTPFISQFLIYDNSASRKNKGVSFHRKRLEKHLHKFYRENNSNEGYILLIDFSQYYNTIPHDLCIQNMCKLLKNVDKEEKQISIWILKNIMKVFAEEGRNKGVDIRKSAKSKYRNIISLRD